MWVLFDWRATRAATCSDNDLLAPWFGLLGKTLSTTVANEGLALLLGVFMPDGRLESSVSSTATSFSRSDALDGGREAGVIVDSFLLRGDGAGDCEPGGGDLDRPKRDVLGQWDVFGSGRCGRGCWRSGCWEFLNTAAAAAEIERIGEVSREAAADLTDLTEPGLLLFLKLCSGGARLLSMRPAAERFLRMGEESLEGFSMLANKSAEFLSWVLPSPLAVLLPPLVVLLVLSPPPTTTSPPPPPTPAGSSLLFTANLVADMTRVGIAREGRGSDSVFALEKVRRNSCVSSLSVRSLPGRRTQGRSAWRMQVR